MSVEEKIGQLFVLPLRSDMSSEGIEEAFKVLDKYHIGSVIFYQGSLDKQMEITLEILSKKNSPYFVMMDSEWGLSQRLQDTLQFPKNLTLGAIQEDDLLYEYGKEIGRELELIGVNFALMPVVDVNTNPYNPVIGMRSFGDDPKKVAKKASLVVKGLNENAIISTAKHFPGHGNTNIDSHHDIVIITGSEKDIESIELLPFKAVVDEGITSIMLGHIRVDSVDNLPASLSKKITDKWLEKYLKFDGLIITDALNMKAIKNYYTPNSAALNAFKAKNHLLLYGDNSEAEIIDLYRNFIPQAFSAIKEAVDSGDISLESLDERVAAIYKFKEGVSQLKKLPHRDEIFTEHAYALSEKLYRKALTFIPRRKEAVNENIVVLDGLNQNHLDFYGLSEETLQKIYDNSDKISLIVIFGSPYVINILPDGVDILVAYEDNAMTRKAVEDFLKGEIKAEGRLPVFLPILNAKESSIDRIFKNECSKNIKKLTHWNEGESFASFGMGHFIWYKEGQKEKFNETFPQFISFAKEEGALLPPWLIHLKGLPWSDREEFFQNIDSKEMKELRSFLINNKYCQFRFIKKRLLSSLEKILTKVDDSLKEQIKSHFLQLSDSEKGAFALLDYVHFKGEGTNDLEQYNGFSWGLKDVLKCMPKKNEDILLSFVESAKQVLTQRVLNAPPERNEERWLKGWHNRVDSYLK